MTEQSLRPCPFCGESVELDYSELPNRKHWFITCVCCGMMYQSPISQRKYVKDNWNNRPIEDALRACAEELEDQLKTLDSNLDFLISENHMLDKKACEYKFRAEKAEAMVERMIGCVDKAKGAVRSYFTLFRAPHVGSFLDDWNALVAEWKERE